MAMNIDLNAIEKAWEAKDPCLVLLIVSLSEQLDSPDPSEAVRDNCPTFEQFLATIFSADFQEKSAEEQKHYRLEQLRLLESEQAELPLSDKLQLHKIILLLWSDQSAFARDCLLQLIQTINLCYGPWRALKQIYKAAELSQDYQILGALSARFDSAIASKQFEISAATLAYMNRRSWRSLRKIALTMPSLYPEICSQFLATYSNNTAWENTWVANHIFYHQGKSYGRGSFRFNRCPKNLYKHRAFSKCWKASPEPLLNLLSMANSNKVSAFAITSLQTDFKIELRDIDSDWIKRLLFVADSNIDDFVLWLLNNAPQFEQQNFLNLGIHQSIIKLLSSDSSDARTYACKYARTYARDMSVTQLLTFANSQYKQVRDFALEQLKSFDPRKDVGLDAWTQLLKTEYGSELAKSVLIKHFGKDDLSAQWFKDCFASAQDSAVEFATERLAKVHSYKNLGLSYFLDIIQQSDPDNYTGEEIIEYAMQVIAKQFVIKDIDTDICQQLLLNPSAQGIFCSWIDNGDYPFKQLDIEFWKTLAYEADWDKSTWVKQLKTEQKWAQQLNYDHELCERVLEWLADVRLVSTSALGFDWLMQLVRSEHALYFKFAVAMMNKAYLPADFAQTEPSTAEVTADKAKDQEAVVVDLQGESFLFTGKLSTMTRKEAQQKVSHHGGSNSSAVNGKLNYLVIGDEGSPLYDNGRKGSKQVKAEKLAEGGAELKIISETAFLKRIAGEVQEHSEDQTLAGCETLWNMATAKEFADKPEAAFALTYLRLHHPDICLRETDRPVDPGSELPDEFVTIERFLSLLNSTQFKLRQFALEFFKLELSRWTPSIEQLIEMADNSNSDVASLLENALLDKDSKEFDRCRIDNSILTIATVYRFCESKSGQTRDLGMKLIAANPNLQQVDALYNLSESPCRRIRSFVIRLLWSLYRTRLVTRPWSPKVIPTTSLGAKNRSDAEQAADNKGPGLSPKEGVFPAEPDSLLALLNKLLFEIPPGRLAKEKGAASVKRITPLSAVKAKVALIETLRDLALEELGFAEQILPLLNTFSLSTGATEKGACLVAITQICERFSLPMQAGFKECI